MKTKMTLSEKILAAKGEKPVVRAGEFLLLKVDKSGVILFSLF